MQLFLAGRSRKKFDKLKKFWYNKFRKKKEIQQTNFKKGIDKRNITWYNLITKDKKGDKTYGSIKKSRKRTFKE